MCRYMLTTKHIHYILFQLIMSSRVLVEKLTVAHLVKKCSALCRTWRFIAVLTTARHWALFRTSWMHATCYTSHPSCYQVLDAFMFSFKLGRQLSVLYDHCHCYLRPLKPEIVHLNILKSRSCVIENTMRMHYKDKPLLLFREIIYLYCENVTERINTLYGRYSEFLMLQQVVHT